MEATVPFPHPSFWRKAFAFSHREGLGIAPKTERKVGEGAIALLLPKKV